MKQATGAFVVCLSVSCSHAPQPRDFNGRWESADIVDGHPRVMVDLASPSGTLLVPGRKENVEVDLHLTISTMKMDGPNLLLHTTLPEKEGEVDWEFHRTSDTSAYLGPVIVNGEHVEEGTDRWTLHRKPLNH